MENMKHWQNDFKKTPVTYILTIAMIGVYVIEVALAHNFVINVDVLYRMGAMFAPSIIGQGEWWRLLTAGFLHGSLIHLLSNLVVLYWFGKILESYLGKLGFGLLFLTSVLGGNVVSLWLDAWQTVSVGASGGVFGMFGAIVVLGTLAKQPNMWRDQVKSMLVLVGLSVIYSLISPGISVTGHIGGFVNGLLLTTGLMWRKPLQNQFKVKPLWNGLSWLVTMCAYVAIISLIMSQYGGLR
ncbi:rhomboid family intramembrane serine protease [Weissella minor]|uniref:Membrane-associated serine protease n=1 Tax=Weissella minor TaxID=1620 RepID=A0A0R2JSZ7_9LACO|nr:rhomboid family intramembrane serine protease [Weissella minor]KRN77770.1 membrane-associated serine protease [Weissella minor]